MEAQNNDFLWRQFCKLGEMIGDGLHYEPDGKWISQEYRKLAKILLPYTKEERQLKSTLKVDSINSQMKKLLEEKKCSCGGALRQSRSGAKVAYCQTCNARYKARVRKGSD
jgi:hypothetical protein